MHLLTGSNQSLSMIARFIRGIPKFLQKRAADIEKVPGPFRLPDFGLSMPVGTVRVINGRTSDLDFKLPKAPRGKSKRKTDTEPPAPL